jgi:hypothetical protein
LSSSITGTAVTRALGGRGTATVGAGDANTGNGADAINSTTGGSFTGRNGGSGVVILRYPDTFTITIGAGLTGSTATLGTDKVTTFTAGTGTVSFA